MHNVNIKMGNKKSDMIILLKLNARILFFLKENKLKYNFKAKR